MSNKRFETELTIKAVDRYSALVKDMGKVTGRFAEKVRTDMKGLQTLRGPLKLIEDFKKAREAAKKSGADMEAAREKLRKLEYQFKTAKTKTSQMYRELEKARSATARLEGAHRRNRRALDGLHTGLRKAGVNTADLAGEQRRLVGALDASTGAFDRQMGKMQMLAGMQETIAKARANMDKSLARSANLSFVGNATLQTGQRILDKVGGPIRAAMDFESAMADVRKVVDFESPEAFKEMSEDILKLGTTIPVTADQLAGIMAIGAGSGISKADLKTFTERAAKIGVAFDIPAENAAEAMAEIKTALKLTLDDTSLLMDAMNQLSNDSAAKAPDTLNYLNRAASAGKQYGFDPEQTLAFGAAMIAAGTGAEVASTSFRNMGKALARGEGVTDRQAAAFKRLGLNSVDVARRMSEDAVGATIDVMKRLNSVPDHLKASTMSDLFGDEARGLAVLVENMSLLEGMLKKTSDATNYAGSASDEYEQRANTLENQLQLLNGKLAELSVTVGQKVFPEIKRMAAMMGKLIEKSVSWTKAHPKLTKWLVIGGVAIGGMAVAAGALLTTAAGLIGTLAVLKFGLVGLGARALFAGGGMAGLVGSFATLRSLPKFALSSLLNPVKWGAKLVSRVPWTVLTGGKFVLSGLLSPIRWTTRFIGRIPWAALVGGKFALKTLVTGLKWTSRFIPGIGWAVLAGELAWHLLLKKLPWSDWIGPVEWKKWFSFKWADALPTWSWDFIPDLDLTGWVKWPEPPAWLKWLMGQEQSVGVSQAPGFAQLPEDQQTAAWTVQPYGDGENLPTTAKLSELRDEVAAYRDEVEAAQAALRSVPEFSNGMTNPLKVQAQTDLDAAEAGLRAAQDELTKTEQASDDLQSALQVLSGTTATPEISTTSIDQALDKVTRLSAKLEAMPGARPAGVTSQTAKPAVAGKRALGGPVSAGLPYLVNEHTPRSEIFVPSVSGAILNVGQAQRALATRFGRLAVGAGRRSPGLGGSMFQGVSAGLAAMAVSSAVLPTSVQAGNAPSVQSPVGGGREVRVEIGSVNIAVPSGVSDPEAIVSLIESSLGERLSGTLDASYAD